MEEFYRGDALRVYSMFDPSLLYGFIAHD